MEKIFYDTIKETLYHEVLDNGLNVYLLQKKDLVKLTVYFQQDLVQ